MSDHFDGTRFFNPGHPSTDRGVGALLRWLLGGGREKWPAEAPAQQTIPDKHVDSLRITLVGHATVLIQAARRNYLVDPVWSQRASPFQAVGPRRVNAPGVAFDHLPPIDTVLLTHNHYDHLDMLTLRRLWERDRPRIITPLGNDAVVGRTRPEIHLETFDWGDSIEVGDDAVVWLHPANHWSARGLGDRRMALWCGFVMVTPAGTIYVSGDTGYGDGRIFRDIKERYPPIDVAVLSIGAYAPRWFMKEQHVDPAEAVQIMLDCGAMQALGVHWGTFPLSNEGQTAPREMLYAELARRGIDKTRFPALAPGDTWQRPD